MSELLPQFLLDLLAAVPRHGDGVHNWLYRVSRHLHAHRTQAEIFSLLKASVTGCGREVPDNEIEDAIKNSVATAWRPRLEGGGDTHLAVREQRWPQVEPRLRARTIARMGCDFYDLWENSPIRFQPGEPAADIVVRSLFKCDELVCVGWQKNAAFTRPLAEFEGEFSGLQYLVPSPMSKPQGLNQKGHPSVRCLDNTNPRRFIVCEFDSGTRDEQAALLLYLGTLRELILVVDSAGKSLHGWFSAQPRGGELRKFFEMAVRLGADKGMWPPCQFARMPGGKRDTGREQAIYWFNPAALP